jgi:hypothetical protein
MISVGDNLGGESSQKNPRKIRVASAYPSFKVIDTASPPVSPSVVARIFTAQNASVTCGTLLNTSVLAAVASSVLNPAPPVRMHKSCP